MREGVRARWAALGAAVAVSLGAGGLGVVRASVAVESTFVAVTPARVLDTRTALGLPGAITSPVGARVQITGAIARPGGSTAIVVPSGATAVVLNVTAVQPEAAGFLSVRPDGTSGPPETSNLNFEARAIVPNAVTVALPPSGAIEVTYDAFGTSGPTTHALIDVTGYYVAGSGGATGPAGPAGPAGATGPAGPAGPPGADGADAFTPARVVHVAHDGTPDGSNGAFTTVAAALASITDASASNPYVVRIGPGTFPGHVVLKSHVDIEGSGRGVTTLTSSGGNNAGFATIRSSLPGVVAEVRDLTVVTTGGTYATGVTFSNASNVRLTNLSIIVQDTSVGAGILNGVSSGPTITDVDVRVEAATNTTGIDNNFGSSPLLVNVDVEAFGATSNNRALRNNNASSPTVRDSSLVAATAVENLGDFTIAQIANTLIDGDLVNLGDGSEIRCFSTFRANFQVRTCP